MNTAKVPVGSTVAVVGLGGVGLSAVLGAQVAGAARIVAVDLSDRKLAELGATDVVNTRNPNHVQAVRDLTSAGIPLRA